ncbi:hypothetical protein F8388_014541 [Cannabis sativa]|uniref:Uncharacterized protein n=1 Tax=Cannabis sativa TaxID=3483 RepID=A0A7J6G1C9_CANSA|nr:hypothetical protein F8388_014541 [Cannabis sativa]
MKDMEDVWFKKDTNCPDPNNMFSSNSLGLESFWGLFLIAGVASSLALVIYAAMSVIDLSSPNTNCPPSPSGFSVHTDSSFVYGEQGVSSPNRNVTQPTDQETVVISAVELTCPNQDSRENLNS